MKQLKTTVAAAVLTVLAYPAVAQTTQATTPPHATGATGTTNAQRASPASDRTMRVADSAVTDRLEQQLKTAKTRDDYRRILEKDGYRISSINSDRKEYLEYEIVKGDQSYEVQLDFDGGATKATQIDVARNIWRAESTEQMMKDPAWRPTSPLVADPDSRFSDRSNMARWNDEKDRLEKALGPNQRPDDYRAKLEQLGYKVTSVNDKERDYVEYEIVKGDNSYEVQIDLDPKTRLATEVDVTSNLWESDATERVKEKS